MEKIPNTLQDVLLPTGRVLFVLASSMCRHAVILVMSVNFLLVWQYIAPGGLCDLYTLACMSIYMPEEGL